MKFEMFVRLDSETHLDECETNDDEIKVFKTRCLGINILIFYIGKRRGRERSCNINVNFYFNIPYRMKGKEKKRRKILF